MIYVLTGATGTGKSRIAVELAKKIGGEIVNADAFQVYEGLKIATAYPDEKDMKEVPHHLYGFVPLNEAYNIHSYQEDCRRVIKEIIDRGHQPILVGGSGLYIRAALYDYDLTVDTTNVDMSVFKDMDNKALHAKLEELDPREAKKIPYQNRVRVERAIALCLAAGKPKSEMIAAQEHAPIYPTKFYVLSKERNDLYPAIEKRVDQMFADGLLKETVPLIERYGRERAAFRAIGVKELFPYLDGECSLEDAKNAIKSDTRHYVKRQETFFRHQFHAKTVRNLEEILSDAAD